MPKNPSTMILKRWKAMDAHLGDLLEGLRIDAFARKWKVSTKTVRRDLEAFMELGQRVRKELDEERRTVWSYDGSEWLFLGNMPRWARKMLEDASKNRSRR